MNSLKTLIELSKSYPGQVVLYKGVNANMLRLIENHLELAEVMKKELIGLLTYTNGFSILDYCFMGIGNPKIASLNFFTPGELILIGTAGDEEFGIDFNEGSRIFYSNNDIYGKNHIQYIQGSLDEFLSLFFEKCEILLANFREEDIVLYLDDDGLPAGLDKFNKTFSPKL